MQLGVRRDDVRLHILRHRLVHVTLRKLAVRLVSVPHQFVGQTPADARDQQVPDGVFQDRPVARLLNVLKISPVATGTRPGERHVADSPGCLAQYLSWHLAVTGPVDALGPQKPFQFVDIQDLTAQNVNMRLTEDADALIVTRWLSHVGPSEPMGGGRRTRPVNKKSGYSGRW
jgi:hypothetical protein